MSAPVCALCSSITTIDTVAADNNISIFFRISFQVSMQDQASVLFTMGALIQFEFLVDAYKFSFCFIVLWQLDNDPFDVCDIKKQVGYNR